jgi:cell wall-associated NlpC family hydrolase
MEELFVSDLPRSTREQFVFGKPVSRARLSPGDLVFFETKARGRVEHVGIYMGYGIFAHASRSRGVVYDELRFFPGRYRGARRLPLKTPETFARSACDWPRRICS